MFRKLAPITAVLTLLAFGAPTALAATQDTATAAASPGPYFVGEPITFTSTTPCTVACRLTWTYLNGTRLGERLGEGVSVAKTFETPGLKTVELELNELCVGSPRLACSSFAFVSVFVQEAPTAADTTPPTFTVSGLTAEATGANTAVNYTFNATDVDDAVVSQSCTPAPGSLFPVGSTAVACTATDSNGNVGNESFDVVVSDTTAPTVSVPSAIVVPATSPAGATVMFTATADDLVDGALTPSCSPASGSVFPIGTTTVSCTSTDAHGNASAASTFTVAVSGAAAQLADTALVVKSWKLQGHALDADVTDLIRTLTKRPARVCGDIAGLIEDLGGSLGKRLTAAQREWLIGELTRIAAVLGC